MIVAVKNMKVLHSSIFYQKLDKLQTIKNVSYLIGYISDV